MPPRPYRGEPSDYPVPKKYCVLLFDKPRHEANQEIGCHHFLIQHKRIVPRLVTAEIKLMRSLWRWESIKTGILSFCAYLRG